MSHLNLDRGLSRTQRVDGGGLITVTLPVMGKGLGWSPTPLNPATRIWEQIIYLRGFPSGSAVKNLPVVQEPQETRV